MKIDAIVCFEKSYGISYKNELPWIKDKIGDLEYLRILTSLTEFDKKNILVLGSKTYDSLPNSMTEIITNRDFYILTSNVGKYTKSNCFTFDCPKKLYLSLLDRNYIKKDITRLFVFGGSQIYKIFLENQWIHTFYVTHILKEYECDIYFPIELLQTSYSKKKSSKIDNKQRIFEEWGRNEHPEYFYLQLLEEVYFLGDKRITRNGETSSKFGFHIEFDLEKYGFPLLTTKKMFFKGILEELLWFLKGNTNVQHLIDKGVHIWDGNSTREYLDSIGLNHYPVRCAGPIYGYQWRYFNAPYNCDIMNYDLRQSFTSTDQLKECIEELQSNPNSRRMIISGWNPNQLKEMCLPPCHVLYQFYVENGKLCVQMYQRSADLFLGLPFNIASTALFTYIIASITNYNVGKIKICIGDAHIYKEHEQNILEQITRTPYPFCSIEIHNKNKDKSLLEQLEGFIYEDFTLKNYSSHTILKSLMKA